MIDGPVAANVLMLTLLSASGWAWIRCAGRRMDARALLGEPPQELLESGATASTTDEALETRPASSPTPRLPWPPYALVLIFSWIAFMAVNRIAADLEGEVHTVEASQVGLSLVVGVGVFAVVGLALFAGGGLHLLDVGITDADLLHQFERGGAVFVAALLPTFLLLGATASLRQPDTQHAFLKLIQDAPQEAPLAMMLVVATVIAPLSEELVFRVALQSWLTERWGARWSIPVTALLFSFIHGWRDGLALIPLAWLLGLSYLYHRRYWTIVVAHSLFNALNLGLALLTLKSIA